MKERTDFKITVENPDGDVLTVTVNKHEDTWKWGDVFRTILTFVTYMPKNIEDLINREDGFKCDCGDENWLDETSERLDVLMDKGDDLTPEERNEMELLAKLMGLYEKKAYG